MEKVIMPKLGLIMEEGTISKWYKKEGDKVEIGDPLFEVETQKITNDVESLVSGVLKQIIVPEGETVDIQEVIAEIEVDK